MEYSLLGPTGVKLSKICLGTATFSVAPDEQESDNCLSAKEERSAAYPRRAPAAHRERLDATPCNDQQASKRLVRLRARPSQREG
jgi:aryl-alcohol dehydrogenase-like predicted oxidoreductase